MRNSILCALLALTSHAMMAACPNFATTLHYPAGTFPNAVAVADFNGDGKLDYATANQSSNNISVRLGDGSGGFGAQTLFDVGSSPSGIVAGDFNGDGKIDLAVSNRGSNNISILLGNGSGGFAAHADTAGGLTPQSITTGDFNRDGKLDLVVTNNLGNNVDVFVGAGDGTFSIAATLVAGDHPNFAVVADFNRDGRPDIAVTDSGTPSNVAVFIGGSAVTFATAVFYPTGTGPTAVAAGDFNGDGAIDLAVSKTSPSASILLNNGDGTFATQTLSATNGNFVVAADFTGDGKLDLALTRNHGVTIAAGDGNGGFAAVFDYDVNVNGSSAIAVGDFNHDSSPDLAVAEWFDNSVAIVMNTGQCNANCATFTSGGTLTTSASPQGVAIGDFNRDGKSDLAVALTSGITASNAVAVFLGNGSGGFGMPQNSPSGLNTTAVAVGDMNLDGRLDLVVANTGNLGWSLLTGDGTGAFARTDYFDRNGLTSAVVADIFPDGTPDILFAAPDRGAVSLWFGSGTDFSGPGYYDTTNTPLFATVGDFNGDGLLDIVSANSGAQDDITILLRNPNGLGGFGAPNGPVSYAAGTSPRSIAVADFNHDGKLDLAVANRGSNNVSILFGNGSGVFSAPTNYAVGAEPVSIAVADFNLDGNPDLAVVNLAANSVSLLMGNGDGTFTAQAGFGTDAGPDFIAVGDFDRDGKPDLAVVNGGANTVQIFLNRCPSPDLSVVKTHIGNFAQGQTGKQYTMRVDNTGNAPTIGTVSVADTLPAGLIATALSGTGWTCNLANVSCTRSDALANGASYPSITLTVSVRSSAPASVTNIATVSGGGDLTPGNNSSSDPTTVTPVSLIAPTDLIATAQSNAQISITWDAVTNANGYRLTRSHDGVTDQLNPATNSYSDTAVTANTTYVYQVAAKNSQNLPGSFSNKDLATTIAFTDDPLVATVKAVHFNELRTAVSAARRTALLSPPIFTDTIAPGVVVKAIHLTELRMYLDQARTAIGVPAINYGEAIVANTTTIKAAHILELRNGVR